MTYLDTSRAVAALLTTLALGDERHMHHLRPRWPQRIMAGRAALSTLLTSLD